MTPQNTSPVLPDASREVDQQQKVAPQAQPGHPAATAGAIRRYHVDDLFGVFPKHYFSKL